MIDAEEYSTPIRQGIASRQLTLGLTKIQMAILSGVTVFFWWGIGFWQILFFTVPLLFVFKATNKTDPYRMDIFLARHILKVPPEKINP